MESKLISVILPVFNEAENIPHIYQAVTTIFKNLSYAYEIIFINDGSRDNSWAIISALSEQDKQIKGINFTRNFGQQMALVAGYDMAQGDAVITMDCDLQDPPEIIVQLIHHWQQGVPIVYARRNDRKDPWLKCITANWYYKLLDTIADVRIPRHVGDFRLVDKRVVEVLRMCRERSRYMRGLVAWTGFACVFVDFARPERVAGQTAYTWRKLFKVAFDGITAFSLFPVYCAFYLGFLGSIWFAILILLAILGFYSSMIMLWSILALSIGHCYLLWLLGEYVGRIYEQIKQRPLYIIAERKNC